MSQTDKGVDDSPEDENENAAAEEQTNLTNEGPEDSGVNVTDDAANETADTQPTEDTQNDDNAGDTGAADTGTGSGIPATSDADQKLFSLTEEETEKNAPGGGTSIQEAIEESTEKEGAGSEAGTGTEQNVDEKQMKRDENEKEKEAQNIKTEELRADIKNKAEGAKAKKKTEEKTLVVDEGFRSTGYESGGMLRTEEVLEADSDFARAFAEQIGLYDEDSVVSDDEEEEEGEDWEKEPDIRDANLLISQPHISEDSTLPQNFLEFRNSFGFDCGKPFNLCVLDPETIVLTAGNMLFFFKVSTGAVTFRRSASGQGLGFIVKHPTLPHFAVGEKGKEPYIIIYEWPAMTLVALLRHGTRRAYSHLDYSPTGELLCSQGGSPDYLFTVWNWKKEKILLRTRSANTDVLNSRFSLYMPGHITTAGMGHIKFWKMCKTFTGLKLKGETGRFGKTEISDIIGIYGMPDEKVVSGCDWGNILVWEAGLIKFEVTRKNRLKCHDGPITQFEFQNGELMTAGKDGFVKSWYFETIDMADPPDDDRFVEVEPMFELEVADHLGPASVISMSRVKPTLKGDTSWYAQDANGGIWLLNLAMTSNATPPKRLYTCHSGQIIGLQTSPISEHFASFDSKGQLNIWDINKSQLLGIKVTPFPGSSLLWLPEDVAPCGCVLLAGLSDGGIRAYAVNTADASQSARSVILDPSSERLFTLIQFLKPHTAPVLRMDISIDHKYIATASSDLTAFVFTVQTEGQFCKLKPVGFVRIPNVPSYLRRHATNPSVFYIGCKNGEIVELTVPENPSHNTDVSYEFTDPTTRTLQTKSIKSQIIRDNYLEEQQRRKNAKLEEKKEELAVLKKENPGLEIDEELFLADSEPEEEIPPLYIPPEKNPVTTVTPAKDDPDCVYVLLGGYDCGYVYKYRFGSEDPESWALYMHSEDDEICSALTNTKRSLMYTGMGDGKIIAGVVRKDVGPTSDMWSIGMHHGRVTQLVLSRNEDYLISAGDDVNIFTYKINAPPPYQSPTKPAVALSKFVPPPAANDVYTLDEPSLEQASGRKENDRRMKEAFAKKSQVEHVLFSLAEQYNKLKRRNRALPKSQVIPREEMELASRVTEDRLKSMGEDADIVKQQNEYALEKARLRFRKLENFITRTLSFDVIVVKGIGKNISVRTIRHTSRAEKFELAKMALERKLREDAKKSKKLSFGSENGRSAFQ